MTTAIHSPGPWKLCYDGEIESADGCTVVSLSFDSYREFSESAENVKANYRLIAAAPELLAALQELLSSQFTPMPPHEEGKDAQDAWADRRATSRNDAAAAIAKATGAAQ
jgi:hypothetical protein